MDFAPGELGTSEWIPGAASSLERHPTQQVSCGQPQEPLSLAWKKDQPLQNPAQGSRRLLAVVLKVGEGRVVEHALWLWKPSCYFEKLIMHSGLFLRSLPGLREPQWKFGEKKTSLPSGVWFSGAN